MKRPPFKLWIVSILSCHFRPDAPNDTPAASSLPFSKKLFPCAPGQQIHIILDNLSAHKTQAVRDFLEQHRRVQFHFTPTYSSWLNQVEIWFAKIERDVIARGIFTSVSDLARKLRRYSNAYSANARPIQCKYSNPIRRIRSNELTATGHYYSSPVLGYCPDSPLRPMRCAPSTWWGLWP
jgi:transposase